MLLIGGEMLQWSDAAPRARPVTLWTELLGRIVRRGTRVLVAAPRPGELVDALVRLDAEVSCLLRSYPDARELADGRSDRLTVYCGIPQKLAAPFDVIVAPDGVGPLHSPESPQPLWRDTMEHLAGLVAPGGALVLTTENDLGLHQLAHARPPESHRGDGDWLAPGLDHTNPVSPHTLATALRGCGLIVDACYAAYPAPDAPRVLIEADLAERDPGLSAAACEPTAGVLCDPRELARRALRRGLGARLAPAWVSVARVGGAPLELPRCLVADDGVADYWSVACEVATDAEGRWVRAVCGARSPRAFGRVLRDPDLLAGPVATGPSIEELLVSACVQDDMRALRTLLREYTRWVSDKPSAFATPDQVVLAGSGFTRVDPSWRFAGELSTDVVVALVLRRFAVRLIEAGLHHPWPWSVDVEEITVTLLALAGRSVDVEVLGRAAEVDAEIEAVLQGGPTPVSAPERLRPYRDLLAAHDRLDGLLGDARARIERLEKKLDKADEQLRKAKTRRRLFAGRDPK